MENYNTSFYFLQKLSLDLMSISFVPSPLRQREKSHSLFSCSLHPFARGKNPLPLLFIPFLLIRRKNPLPLLLFPSHLTRRKKIPSTLFVPSALNQRNNPPTLLLVLVPSPVFVQPAGRKFYPLIHQNFPFTLSLHSF